MKMKLLGIKNCLKRIINQKDLNIIILIVIFIVFFILIRKIKLAILVIIFTGFK